jgi:hypothetical protein
MYTYKTLPLSVADADRRHEVERLHSLRRRFGLLVGNVAARYGLQRAARLAGVSKRTALYWKRKARDPAFHAGSWGGSRPNSMLFGSTANDLAVQAVVYHAIVDDPDVSFRALLERLRAIPGLEGMTAWWLSTTIKSWNWDWAMARLVARNKYTDSNMREWIEYAVQVLDIPLNKVQ